MDIKHPEFPAFETHENGGEEYWTALTAEGRRTMMDLDALKDGWGIYVYSFHARDLGIEGGYARRGFETVEQAMAFCYAQGWVQETET
jgi:hypothetical protein